MTHTKGWIKGYQDARGAGRYDPQSKSDRREYHRGWQTGQRMERKRGTG